MGRYNSKFYNKSLEIKKISKKISDYIIFELSNSTDYSKNTILFFSGDIVQQSDIISEEIIKAQVSLISENKNSHIKTIQWLIFRLMQTCKRIENSCINSKDYISILVKEINKFKLLKKSWLLTL
jgi:hypothetical protein